MGDKNIKTVEDALKDTNFEVEEKVFEVSGWGHRHTQCVLLFLTLTVAYSTRSCMGVALVAMVEGDIPNDTMLNHTINNLINETSFETNARLISHHDNFEVHGFFNALLITPPFSSFKWTKKTQDTIMSSFFWGYMSLQIPAGQLAHRFGSRRLIAGSMMVNCIIPVFLPIATYYGGWICMLLCRIIQGMTQACIIPGFHTMLGKWAPLEERGRMNAIIFGGQAIGTVLGLPITGYIASSPMGWPGIFRFYGLLAGSLCIIIWLFLADSPAQHKTISAAERRHIEEALGQTKQKKQMKVPWKKIFKCKGMWAIIFAHTGTAWGQVTLFTELPAFMDKVMGVNIKTNGLLTALPFMVMWFTNFFFSWFTDMLIVKKFLTVTNTRKLANTLGCVPPAVGLIVLAFIPKNIYVVEGILVFICSFKISAHVGFHVNHVDIAPNFAGTMISISNFAANAIGSLAPIVAGLILTDVTDERLWRYVFLVSAAMYLLTNTVYIILGSAELVEWNDPEYEEVATDEKANYNEKDENKNTQKPSDDNQV